MKNLIQCNRHSLINTIFVSTGKMLTMGRSNFFMIKIPIKRSCAKLSFCYSSFCFALLNSKHLPAR